MRKQYLSVDYADGRKLPGAGIIMILMNFMFYVYVYVSV
jgi:hypothetical protein